MHVPVVAIAVIEQQSQRAATWQTRVLIDAVRTIQSIALDRNTSRETKQSRLIATGQVLQLVIEENIQNRINHVPCRFFRQIDPTNIVMAKAGLRRGRKQLITKAVTISRG